MVWIGRAQDCTRTRDGGAARRASLIEGRASSYPKTTGYIVTTLLDVARVRGGTVAEEARWRARRMLDWLVSIRLPEGGLQGGMIDQEPVVPVTFNTGQILLGLAAGVRELGGVYRDPMNRAATWLVPTQDPDGCWRKYPTPFAAPGEKAYEAHVAWGLLEAYRVQPEERYRDAALAKIRWALGLQRENGWFDGCGLEDAAAPLTHTIGYVLRGGAGGLPEPPGPVAAGRGAPDGRRGLVGPAVGWIPARTAGPSPAGLGTLVLPHRHGPY